MSVHLSLGGGSECACVVRAVMQVIFLCIDRDCERIPKGTGWRQQRLEGVRQCGWDGRWSFAFLTIHSYFNVVHAVSEETKDFSRPVRTKMGKHRAALFGPRGK